MHHRADAAGTLTGLTLPYRRRDGQVAAADGPGLAGGHADVRGAQRGVERLGRSAEPARARLRAGRPHTSRLPRGDHGDCRQVRPRGLCAGQTERVLAQAGVCATSGCGQERGRQDPLGDCGKASASARKGMKAAVVSAWIESLKYFIRNDHVAACGLRTATLPILTPDTLALPLWYNAHLTSLLPATV